MRTFLALVKFNYEEDNVDTGAGHGGPLTIMDVHTKEYWQSEPVK